MNKKVILLRTAIIIGVFTAICVVFTEAVMYLGIISMRNNVHANDNILEALNHIAILPKDQQNEYLQTVGADFTIHDDLTAPKVEEEAEAFASSFCIKDSDKVLLKCEDLMRQYSAGELYFAYYEIFARFGVIFDEPVLDAYFGAKDWYQPKMTISEFENDDTIVMNDYEVENKNSIMTAFLYLYEGEGAE